MNKITNVKEWIKCQKEILDPLEIIRQKLLLYPSLEHESKFVDDIEVIAQKLKNLQDYYENLMEKSSISFNFEEVLSPSEIHNKYKHLMLKEDRDINSYFNYVFEKSHELTTFYKVIIRQIK